MIDSRIYNFNDGWLFKLTGESSLEKNLVNDSNWRKLDVPHDWSIEQSFSQELGEGCTAYLPGGIGWYRKHFKSPINQADGKVHFNFDGIYNHSRIYINGKELAYRPYGYVPITVDVTKYLNPMGENNVIAVRVDRSRYLDSRWYPGSGIYRKVDMVVTNHLYIPIHGIFVKNKEVSEEKALLEACFTIKNDSSKQVNYKLVNRIYDKSSVLVGEIEVSKELSEGQETELKVDLEIGKPHLWDIYTPNLYELETELVVGEALVQSIRTPFGARDIRFDVNKGFFINGRNELIKGVCLHHDGGLVGAAVPKGVWRRRLNKLIEGGCNAIRTAHNPPSAEFLELCDELGIMVQNEFFDEWDNPKDKRQNTYEQHDDYISRGYAEDFHEWGQRDLEDAVKRDRNHPCIIQWSIGNEIEWPYPNTLSATGYFGADASGNYFWSKPPFSPEEITQRYLELPKEAHPIEDTARQLAKWTRALDDTRPITANCILPSGSHAAGATDELDIVGYSYRRVMYDHLHESYPTQAMMGTENLAQWHDWKAVLEREFISGMFIWSGIEYLGEAREAWPRKATKSGMLNLAGFEKGSYNMMKSLWISDPVIAIYTNTSDDSIYQMNDKGELVDTTNGGWEQRLWPWHEVNRHWNYSVGTQNIVEIYTNCDEIELFIDENTLGKKVLADFDDHIMKWVVDYKPGQLKAVGYMDGQVVSENCLVTTDEASHIRLTTDTTSLINDNEDVVHIVAVLEDCNGNEIEWDNRTITFDVNGPCKNLGVDNGWNSSVQDYKSDTVMTHEGKCLMILQAGYELGKINIVATGAGLESNCLEISVKSK